MRIVVPSKSCDGQGQGWRSSAGPVHSGSTQRRASPGAILDIECNVVATHVSAASPTRVDSPLPWGEGVALRRCRQPERDG